MIPVTPTHRVLLAGAVVVHAWLVWSVAAQPFDGSAPPAAPRFATARLHFDAVHWPGPGADFFALYHAGVQVRRGLSPYDQHEDPRVTPYFFRYIYSPLLAETLGRLVTLFSPTTAYRVWLGVIEGCLLGCLVVFWRRSRDTSSRIAGSTLLLLSQPYILELHMGQFTFVAASLALLAASLVERSDRHGGRVLAVPLLMMAGLLKTFPFVTLPAFIRDRRGWPAAAGATVAALSMATWSLFANEGSKYLSAFTLAADINGPHPGALSLLQAVFVIVSAATGLWLPRAFGALPLIVMVLLLAWTAWVVLRARRHDVVTGSAVLLLAFFLAFLHVWEHHYSAVLLAGVFLLDRVAAERRERPASMPLLLIALAVIAAPSPFALVSRDPQAWVVGTWLLMSTSKAVPAVVVFVIGMRALSAQPPTA